MISQQNISVSTPMGATLLPGGGATFRFWAPRANGVYLNGVFGGVSMKGHTSATMLTKDAVGYWSGFVGSAKEGDGYKFWVDGPGPNGSRGFKRDPYARELSTDAPFPDCSCMIRAADAYPWHDARFITPDFSNMIIYQAHIGTYAISKANTSSTFLDLIGKIPYLVALGINVLQPLPVDEVETDPSMGYNGADLFSPDFPYIVTVPATLGQHLGTINNLLTAKGLTPLVIADIVPGPAQLKVLVDLCHVYGIAVAFDVVYNHAGGFTVNNALDDTCIYYGDRMNNVGNNNDSLYFTDQDRGTGGLSFALWNQCVCQFLIDNAKYYIAEFHADGFRYDEISDLISMNCDSGWSFCCNLTDTLRCLKPRLVQNAEYWPNEVGNYPRSTTQLIVSSTAASGAGFDVVQHDGLRSAVRIAIQSASEGSQAQVDMDRIASNLFPQGFTHGWQAVTCVENHDIVKVGAEQRIPTLADPSDRRSWYARSRSRFALGLVLTAPGIPQLFMGQEFLEDKQWSWDPTSSNLLWWNGLASGDKAMIDYLRFSQDLIRLRWNQPALRGENISPFHVHNQNRVIAYHRWLEGTGQDVVIVATLAESTWYNYAVGFPSSGNWLEIFNSDVYDNWVNPIVAGNGGGVSASGPALHGLPASANVVIPANGFVVFARG